MSVSCGKVLGFVTQLSTLTLLPTLLSGSILCHLTFSFAFVISTSTTNYNILLLVVITCWHKNCIDRRNSLNLLMKVR